jgi:hypothetical protein
MIVFVSPEIHGLLLLAASLVILSPGPEMLTAFIRSVALGYVPALDFATGLIST